MTENRTNASGEVAFVLNRPKLDELRRANGIESEGDLARIIGVNPATLYRVTQGLTRPSSAFMARMKLAFPYVPVETLFRLETLSA